MGSGASKPAVGFSYIVGVMEGGGIPVTYGGSIICPIGVLDRNKGEEGAQGFVPDPGF